MTKTARVTLYTFITLVVLALLFDNTFKLVQKAKRQVKNEYVKSEIIKIEAQMSDDDWDNFATAAGVPLAQVKVEIQDFLHDLADGKIDFYFTKDDFEFKTVPKRELSTTEIVIQCYIQRLLDDPTAPDRHPELFKLRKQQLNETDKQE